MDSLSLKTKWLKPQLSEIIQKYTQSCKNSLTKNYFSETNTTVPVFTGFYSRFDLKNGHNNSPSPNNKNPEHI